MIRIAWFGVLIGAFSLAVGCKAKKKGESISANDNASGTSDSVQPTEPAVDLAPKPPTLPDPDQAATSKELRASIESWSAQAVPLELVSENLRPWLRETFGPELGATLEVDEKSIRAEATSFPRTIRYHASAHNRRKIVIEKFTDPAAPGATGYQAAALSAMVKPTALFSVRYVAPGSPGELHLYNFVHDGTRFRYVGRLTKVADGSAKQLSMRQRAVTKTSAGTK